MEAEDSLGSIRINKNGEVRRSQDMNRFKKRKAIKEGKIIVDHGDNDIRIYRTPKDLINIGQESEEKEKTNHEQRK